MKFSPNLGMVALLVLALGGCSGSGSAPAEATAPAAKAASPSDPIAAVAYDFMDAVFANDIVRATQRLTPLAIQNMQAQDKRFEWGAAAAKLEIGEVRVAEDEAAVACFVTSDEGSEELLCVLRKVGEQWRVYGVAWEGSDGGQPQVVNFEDLPPTQQEQSRPTSGNRYVQTPAPQIPATPTAEVAEQPAGVVR